MVTDVASCQWLSSTNKKESNRRKQGWGKVESDSCLYISSVASKQVTTLYHVSRQPLKGGKLRFEMKTCQRQVQKTMTTAHPLKRRRFIPHYTVNELMFHHGDSNYYNQEHNIGIFFYPSSHEKGNGVCIE